MSEHRWTLAEYDALHAEVGLGPEWLASERRRETAAEIAAGVGPGELRAEGGGGPQTNEVAPQSDSGADAGGNATRVIRGAQRGDSA